MKADKKKTRKALFKEVEAGMVIRSDRANGLILTINHKKGQKATMKAHHNWGKNSLCYHSSNDATYGPCVGQFKPNTTVTILEGEEREEVIKKIERSLRKEIWNREKDLDRIIMIRELYSSHTIS